MSKRSYRRLAVVTGAALAIGSMAPAMAVRVGAKADGNLSVDTIDVSDVLGRVQSTALPLGGVLTTVGTVRNTALSTAFLTLNDVQAIVGDAVGGVTCVAGAGTGAVLGVTAGALATAGVGVGLGGLQVDVGARAPVNAPLVLVGDVTECLDDLKAGVFTTVGHAKAGVGGVATLATTTAIGAVGTVQSVPGTVLGFATPLLLTDLLNIRASASAAGLVSIF